MLVVKSLPSFFCESNLWWSVAWPTIPKNIPVLIDGTQGAPHSYIDMQKIGCDFYAISCHKMYGPNGLGILYMKKKWIENLPSYQGGDGMINEV